MPIATVYDEAVKHALEQLFVQSPNTIKVDLFTTNVAIARTDTVDDYVLASYPGYVQYIWTPRPTSIGGDHIGRAVPTIASFIAPTSAGNVDVYGWISRWVRQSDGALQMFMGALFPSGPIELIEDGEPLVFDLFLTMRDLHL